MLSLWVREGNKSQIEKDMQYVKQTFAFRFAAAFFSLFFFASIMSLSSDISFKMSSSSSLAGKSSPETSFWDAALPFSERSLRIASLHLKQEIVYNHHMQVWEILNR